MNINLEIILNFTCLVGLVCIFLSFIPKINNFFDIRTIVSNHFKIFNGNYFQMISIYFFPVLFSIWIVMRQQVTKEILEEVNLIITILTSMFFAIIGVLGSVNVNKKNNKYKKIVEETFNSTLFEIICCIAILLISFILIFINNYQETTCLKIFSIIIYYLFIIVVFNIMLILKRIKMIIEKNLED